MQRATVYQRDSAILVHTSSETVDGIWILTEPCIRLPIGCSDRELGDALSSAFEESKESLPPPTQWKMIVAPLLTAAGVRSWKAFARGAVCVHAEYESRYLSLIPTINLGVTGANRGFVEASDAATRVAMPPDAAAVGVLIRQA